MNKNKEKIFLKKLLDDGLVFLNKKKSKLAIKKFEKILSYRPKNSQILNLIGIAYHQISEYDKAVLFINSAIKYNPNEIGFYINLGNTYKDIKKYQTALEVYNQALRINNQSIDVFYNKGVLYTSQHKPKEAVQYYKQALKVDKYHIFSLDNLASAYAELGKFKEAINFYNYAVKIDSNFAQAQFNLSLALLLTSSLKHGWEKYEYRLKKNNYKKNKYLLKYKYWNGENLNKKTLLIYCEQGIGDCIQFARYIKKIKKNNTTIILLCNKEIKLFFKNLIEIDHIITLNKNITKVDYYISLMSLPYIFRNEKTPETYKYIKQDDKLSKFWRSKFITKKYKVGLVWQGDKIHVSDYKRSISLNKLIPLLKVQNIEFISLQKGFGREQILLNKLEKNIIDFFDNIQSFHDTVAIIDNLDLIISVDTAIAHIAATMGKETWILLPFVPDFRWGLYKPKTNWYNTVTLFRQKKINDWDLPIKSIKKSLIKKFN